MKNKSLFGSILGFCLFALIPVVSFISCQVGLGEAVDVAAPVITIDTPKTSAIIRDTFAITGTWSDDGSIKSVEVELRNTGTDKTYSDFEPVLTMVPDTKEYKGDWYVSIDPVTAKVPDGSYEATVTITDNGKHSTEITRTFIIDNTSPVMVLSRPSSSKTDSDNLVESYGQYLTLEGQAADDNDIEKIVINFYSKDTPETLLWTKEITSVPPTISLDVAKFLDKDVYTKIYGDEKAGEKYYYCTITAYDSAKRYPLAGQEKTDDELGNAESSYILWADWEKFQSDYQKASGGNTKLKVPDLYAIKAGTSASSTRSATETSLIEGLFEKAIPCGSFKLNPENSPTFSISGLELGTTTDVENERALTVQLAKGLDGLSLLTDDMKVYLIPVSIDENNNEVLGKKIYPQTSEFQKKGDGQFLTKILKEDCKDADGVTVTLEYGKTYIIGVDGKDIENNKIVPSFDGKQYYIKFKAKNVAPSLTITTPSATTLYLKKGQVLEFTGTTSVPDGYPTVSITCKKGEETTPTTIFSYKVTQNDYLRTEGGLLVYKFNYTVPIDGTGFAFDQDKSDQYTFDITADLEDMPTTRTKTVIYDIAGPTISIDSMLPTAEKFTGAEDGTKLAGEYLNGDVTMKVAILDEDDVVQTLLEAGNDRRPYFTIVDATTDEEIEFRVGSETAPIKKHLITTPAKQSFVIHTEDIASGTQSRKIKVKIFAQDRAGNLGVDFDDRTKTAFEREYTVDQTTDVPVILPYNAASLTLTYDTVDKINDALAEKNFKSILTTGTDLQLSLKDDDGIEKIDFFIGNLETPIANNATPTTTTLTDKPSDYNFRYTVPTISGRYECRIIVYDTVGKTNEKKFWIIATGLAPQVSISGTTPDNKVITLSTGSKEEAAKVKFVNELEIESGYDEFTVSRFEKVNGTEVETQLYSQDNKLSGHSFTDNFIPAAGHSENKIRYVVTDEMGHTGEREFVYYTDSAAPVVDASTILVPGNTATESVSYRFGADSSDPSEGEVNTGYKASGVSKLQYVFESGAASTAPSSAVTSKIKTANGVSSLNETIIFGDNDFNYVFDTEGTKTIYVRAIDDVGNIGAWAHKEFMFDTAAPSLSIVSYKRDTVDTDYVALPTGSEKVFQTGKQFEIKGTASDATGLSSFEIWQNDLQLEISKDDISNGAWSISGLPKDAAGGTVVDSGTYTYTVKATDNSAFGEDSAKTTIQTVTVNIDVTDPRVKIGLANGDTLNSNTVTLDSTIYGVGSISGSAPYTFNGQASDDELSSATGVRELFYTFTTTDETPAESSYTSYGNPSGGNWNIPMNLGTGKNGGTEIKIENGVPTTLYEGQKYLWVYLYDNAGNKSGIKHVGFMVDQAVPAIIETKVHKLTGTGSNITESSTPENPTGNTIYLNEASNATGYTLRGKVSDVNGISKVTVDGADATLATSANADGSYNWSWTNDNTQGDYNHEIVVYDKSGKNGAAGKSNSTKVHVIFDTTPPTADTASDDHFDADKTTKSKWIKGTGSTIINGTASEEANGSGLKSIYYKVDKGENDYPTDNNLNGWKKLPTSTSWTDAYDPSSLAENANTDNDCHTITVLVYDNAGNKGEKTRYFRYDKQNPTIKFIDTPTVTNPAVNSYNNAGFTLQVEASDTNGVQKVEIYKGNTKLADATAGSDGIYSKAFTVGTASGALEDGTHDFTIRVIDIAGNIAEVTRSFTIDTNKPSITQVKINSVVVNKGSNPSGWYNTQAIPLTVTAEDNSGGSGVYTVEYQTLTASETTLNDSKWIPLSSQTSGYSGSAIFSGAGTGQKLYIRVKDLAGNVDYFNTNNDPVLLKIDTTVPTVGNSFWYKLDGETTATQSTGQIYVNGTKDLIVYGPASDPESGLSSVSFKIGDDSVTPSSIKYATTGTDATIASQTYSDSGVDTKAIKYWMATFSKASIDSKEESGTLKVTATNGAVGANGTGASSPETTVLNITYDNTKPVPVINSFTSTNTKKHPYKKSETEYYLNNKDGNPKFTLEGIASDNCGVKDVTLTIGGTAVTRDSSSSLNEWKFTNIDLKSYAETATPSAVLTVTDVAGNTETKKFTIKFDVTAPKAKHWADAKNKDIYFRIGDADNDKSGSTWETGDAVSTSNDPLNKDVGSKYSYGSYGKDSSMELRGTFEESGSQLKAVYYKIYISAPTSTQISNFVDGTDSADGNITIVNETRHVPYNVADGTDSNGKPKYKKLSETVISNFRGQIPGFDATNNYLVLVAQDYAGNRAADTLAIYGGPASPTPDANWNAPKNDTLKNYYSLNKDTTPPTITGSIKAGSYTNGTGDLVLEGTVSDNAAGVKSVTVRIDDGAEQTATVTDGNWTKTIDVSTFVDDNTQSGTFTVYATATDNAGVGNTKQISVGTITVDTSDPDFSNIKVTETESSTTKDVYSTTASNVTSYYVKNNASGKTFKISGLATDNFGVESVKLDVVANSTTKLDTQEKTGEAIKGTCEFTIGDWSDWEVASATATITVKDKAGNEITKDLNIKFDRGSPTVDKTKLTLPTKAQTESSLFTFKGDAGSVADSISAPEKIDIAFTSNTTAPTAAQVSGIEVSSSGTTKGSWSTTVDFTQNSVFNSEGTKYLWIKPYDKTGNAGSWTSSNAFTYDKATPTINFEDTSTVTNPAVNSYNKAGFTLQVKATDTYGVQKVEIYNGATKLADATAGSNGIYSKAFTVGTGTGALADGTYNFTVKVTDKAGKENSVSRSIYVDATNPVISAFAVQDTLTPFIDSSSHNWYNRTQIPLTVTVTDALSGMASVQAYVDSDSGNPASLIKGTGTSTTWTGNIVCNTEGSHIIHIVATDVAGNQNIDKSIPVYIDTTAPQSPIFLGAGPSGSIASANDITSLLVNPTLGQPVIVYAALKDEGTTANSTGIATTAAFKQKGKSETYATAAAASTITAFTPDWADSHEYVEGNIVKNSNTLYLCKTSHTSGTTFANTNWTSLSDYAIWSYTIQTTDMTSGGINFTVKDKAGNEADYVLFQMTVDKKAPVVTPEALVDADLETDGKQINGIISINGSASDENGLSTTETMKLYYTTNTALGTATTDPVASNFGDTADSQWKQIKTTTADNTWSFTNIDTSKLDGTNTITDQTTVYFLVVVQDKAGNVGYSARDAKLTAKVDQDSDRPVIKFTNLKFDTGDTAHPAMSATYLVPHQQTDLYGSITDDDGITSVHYIMSADSDPAANATGWQTLTLENGSFTLNFDAADGDAGDGDGTKKLYFKIKDTANNTFISSATDSLNLKTPKLKDNSATAVKYGYRNSSTGYKQTVAFLKVDNHAPFEGSLQFTLKSGATDNPAAADWKSKSEISSMPFGGPNEKKTFKIRIPAWDANDIKTVSMTLTGSDETDTTNETITFTDSTTNAGNTTYTAATWWISPEIDVSTLGTGNKNCTITVSDGVKTSSDDFVIAIDNTPPNISATNPSSSQYSSGNVIAYGETDLTYWKNTSVTDQPKEFMYYALSLDDTTTPAADFEAASSNSAATITSWKDENGTEITDTNKPAGANVTLSYKPYYTTIKGGSFNWYVYFDDGASTENDSHDISFKQFLINSGVTTQEAIETTDQDEKFRTKVQAYLWIKAVDQVGNPTVLKHPILIDPQGDAPTVTIDYPETDGTTLGGNVTLRGTAKDEKGNNPGVDTVWVQIISARENGYTSTDATQTWTTGGLKFTDTVTNGNHSYAVTDFKPTMKDVKQWINAKDSSNNKLYNVYTNITDATPTPVTSVDNTWVDTADGSKYYIKAKFSGSAWSLDINKGNEYNPATGKLNPIAYRVFAKDKDKNLSSYEQQLSVFDSDNPILGNLYLRQYANNDAGTGDVTASRPYEDDMWINGIWWLYGTVTDTDGLSVLTVKGTSQNPNGQTGTIKYKVSTTNDVDSFELEIVASDNASTPHTTRKTCIINYDKKEPELAATTSSDFNISSAIQNSNGFYTFGSQVTENQEGGKAQSGFDYLAFWFERNITGKRVVFDVMRPKSITADNVTTNDVSEVAWTSLATFTEEADAKGLKWKKITTTRTSADLGKLTINTEDKNIHVGGICMISGSIYFITSVEKNAQNKWEIGINGQPEYTTATQDVYFAIANVVNNTVESGRGAKLTTDGAYGYYSTVDNDDGDHMLESVKKQGTSWTWEANINSQNMPDGSITLHYVAFDKAGNFITGQVDGNVANNAPRIASLKVWSDFNENGTEEDGESETRWVNGKERKINDSYSTRSTGVTDELIVSNNNKDYDNGGSAFMTVKATTRFIPELVGGNGDLYYTYKYGTADTLDSATVKIGSTSIGKGADDGIDEDIDNSGYYVEDQNQAGYINGRTDLYDEDTDDDDKHYMEIPGKLETETAGTYSLNALGNSTTESGPTWFEYTIYDSTEGSSSTWNTTTLDTTNRLSAKFRVALNLKYQDTTRPVVKIRPFYWNSLTDNSVDKPASPSSVADLRGHIELEGDLTDNIKGNGEGQLGMGDDPKVSGKIIVEGYAYDDIKLKELYVQMSNHTNLKGSGTTGVKVASYDGSWTTTTHAADAGWDFTASDVYCNGNGHLVYWKLTVDTAKRTTVAATDQTVVVYAVDARGSDATKTSIHNGTTQTTLPTYIWGDVKGQTNSLKTYYTDFYCNTSVTASTPESTIVYKASDLETSMTYYYQMDIVPYITKVTTGLSSLKNAKQDSIYSRTSLGHYPVSVKNTGDDDADELTNTITISGFNLGTTTTVSLASISTEAATKGYYDHKVSNIPALNNYNKNDASGTSYVTLSNADVDYEKINKYGYNRMPNNSNNNKLTDDVIFDVWRINSDAARTYEGNTALREPVVRVNPTNGVVGMAFGNGSSRFSMPNKAGDNTGTSYELWQYNYATYVNIALCYDENGVAHGISTGIDTYVTNTAQKAGRMSYFKSAWGPSRLDSVSGNFDGGNAIRFDCIGIPRNTTTAFGVTTGSDPLLEEYRFYSPSIVATGKNRTNPTVYYAYYDKLSQQIRFRAGDIGDTVGTNGQFYQASASGEPAFIDNHYSVISGTSNYSNKNNMYNGGKYLGIDVIPGTSHNDDVVVAVWQDAITDALIFAYNDAPYAKVNTQWNTDTGVSGWKGYTLVKENAGFYCKVKCDSTGNVHIASVNDQDEVCYTYIPYTAGTKTFGTPVTVTIDTFESGVKKVAIDVDKNNLPYITYFGTKGQPKMAYLPSMPATKSETTLKGCDTNGFTGVWEVGFIPTNSKLADDDARNQTSVWAPKDLTGTAATTNFYGTGGKEKAAGITISNTTSPLVGYGVSPDGTSGRIELAQKR